MSSKRSFDRSGPRASAIDVEPATSATSTETIRRALTACDIAQLYASRNGIDMGVALLPRSTDIGYPGRSPGIRLTVDIV